MWWPFRWRRKRRIEAPARAAEQRRTLVVLIDGTLSTMEPGYETNVGLIYRLLDEEARALQQIDISYQAGIQWRGWRHAIDVIAGLGINNQIRTAYGFLAARYRPGDRIVLIGYSRGAYAVRSLAGMIDKLGLLRPQAATTRNVERIFNYYQTDPGTREARIFAAARCHPSVEIEMIGAFDTVKALGLHWPLLWRIAPVPTEFHDVGVSGCVRHAFHALARDETRVAFAPVLWETGPDTTAEVVQVWFPGAHGDVGGQLGDFQVARPLANIPLVWMLERLEACGVALPSGWKARYPRDPHAPSVGTWRGYAKLFVWRRRRVIGRDPSERRWEELPEAAELLKPRHHPAPPAPAQPSEAGELGVSAAPAGR